MSSNKIAIGIDLGTANSCVGVFKDDEVQIIPNSQGKFMLPSYVAFTKSEVLVGDAAKDQMLRNPHNTIYDVKRFMGLRFNNPSLEAEIKRVPYKVINHNSKIKIEVNYKSKVKTLYPEEISSLILMQLKRQAEQFLNNKVTDVVITVPAYFTDRQRQATKDACALANLNVLRITNEPTAVAIAAGLAKGLNGEKKVLVFDLGGATFSVSILTAEDGSLEVMATGGDLHIGGVNFEQALAYHILANIKMNRRKDFSTDPKTVKQLIEACEKTKIQLTTEDEADVEMRHLNIVKTITRKQFESICASVFQEIFGKVQKIIKDAKLDPIEITHIVLAGGGTQVPQIQQFLTLLCPRATICKGLIAEHAVAIGATLQAAMLSGVQSDSLSRLLILDLLPYSLGVEVGGGHVSPLIMRHQTIPVKKTTVFSTNSDYQTKLTIKVYEAEHLKTIDNQLLGHFEICDIPKAKRGEVSIAVTFEVDINGILSVSARDLSSKTANEMRVLYDKGSLDLGAKYDELAMPLRTSASSDNKKMEVALKDFANVIHKAMGEDRDCPLIPLELAMNQRSCNRTLMKLCHSTDEVKEKDRLKKELHKLEEAYESVMASRHKHPK